METSKEQLPPCRLHMLHLQVQVLDRTGIAAQNLFGSCQYRKLYTQPEGKSALDSMRAILSHLFQ